MPIAYLHFQGICAEALTFYADAFGATDLQMMRYSDAPGMPEGMSDATRVIHGQLTLSDGVLMASDFPPGIGGDAQKAVSVMHVADSVAIGQKIFDRLLDGGDVVQAFGPSFFSEGFGMLRDRFGTHWMISVRPSMTAG